MSKGTWFGQLFTGDRSWMTGTLKQKYKDKRARQIEEQEAAGAQEATRVQARAAATAVDQRQKAKQFAAINTPSKGFGSNEKENLSRSFLLRL